MKGVRILSELGSEENKALLCEIPAEWTNDIPIAADGSVDPINLLKLLRKGVLNEYLKSPQELPSFEDMMKSLRKKKNKDKPKPSDKSISKQFNMPLTQRPYFKSLSLAAAHQGKLPLYELIFNPNLAVDPDHDHL